MTPCCLILFSVQENMSSWQLTFIWREKLATLSSRPTCHVSWLSFCHKCLSGLIENLSLPAQSLVSVALWIMGEKHFPSQSRGKKSGGMNPCWRYRMVSKPNISNDIVRCTIHIPTPLFRIWLLEILGGINWIFSEKCVNLVQRVEKN